MKLGEILDFDERKYWKMIRAKNYTFGELATDIYKKRRIILGSAVTAIGGVACAAVTGGISLFSSAYAGRNVDVEKQKLELLERLWARTGARALPARPVKDQLIPVAIATAVGLFTFTVDLGISNAVSTAAYAAQMNMPGYAMSINPHLISGEYGAIERGMGWAGGHANGMVADNGGGTWDDVPISNAHGRSQREGWGQGGGWNHGGGWGGRGGGWNQGGGGQGGGWNHGGGQGGGWNQGGGGQGGGWNQGGWNQGGWNQGGWNQGGWNQGGGGRGGGWNQGGGW